MLIQSTIFGNKKKKHRIFPETDYERKQRERAIEFKRHTKDFFLIGLGIFSAAFGFKGFLLGWTGFMQKQIQKQAIASLKNYIKAQS